jgi:hypothetical protein
MPAALGGEGETTGDVRVTDQNKEFEAIKARHTLDDDWGCSTPEEVEQIHTDRATLITLVESERARADKAEAELADLRALIQQVSS